MCGRSGQEAGVAGAPSVGGEWASGRDEGSVLVRLPGAVCARVFLQEGRKW